MEPKDNEKETDRTPDFVQDRTQVHQFGDNEDEVHEQENFPEAGSLPKGGIDLKSAEPEKDPLHDGDDSLA